MENFTIEHNDSPSVKKLDLDKSGRLEVDEIQEILKKIDTIQVQDIKDIVHAFKDELQDIHAAIKSKTKKGISLNTKESTVKKIFENPNFKKSQGTLLAAKKKVKGQEKMIDKAVYKRLQSYKDLSRSEMKSNKQVIEDLQTVLDGHIDMSKFGGIDGVYGPKTKKAITLLQAYINQHVSDQEKLVPNGKFDFTMIQIYLSVRDKIQTKKTKTSNITYNNGIDVRRDMLTATPPKIHKEKNLNREDISQMTPEELQDFVKNNPKELENLINSEERVVMGAVPNKNKSEFFYQLGESAWDVKQAIDFGLAVKNTDPLKRLEQDKYGEKGAHVFDVSFNVDMKPVKKQSTKLQINRNYGIYSEIANMILSKNNRSYLDAYTTEWKGGYDSEYNAKLAFNRAMNAIVSTYTMSNTDFSRLLSKSKTLSEVHSLFHQEKKHNNLPDYAFVIRSDGIGQSKYMGKRASTVKYLGQLDHEGTQKGNGWYSFTDEDGEHWYMDFDPRHSGVSGNGHGILPKNPPKNRKSGKTQEEQLRDGSRKRFDDQGNYL